jgi:hypothetical protein
VGGIFAKSVEVGSTQARWTMGRRLKQAEKLIRRPGDVGGEELA